ncbi:hypothetical protein PILCRDRAFT_527030 [Piloderma croceum F 1598]|uniref:Uncharacterized protein n=1 Tax=Piloderma croceum (strain F 1598) TaxID=765440 RepID=A0A0C3FL51_PILCF|nr:hypothetical protein PILCRDRAFT_527030 [Piloderma croceum F 1598]
MISYPPPGLSEQRDSHSIPRILITYFIYPGGGSRSISSLEIMISYPPPGLSEQRDSHSIPRILITYFIYVLRYSQSV